MEYQVSAASESDVAAGLAEFDIAASGTGLGVTTIAAPAALVVGIAGVQLYTLGSMGSTKSDIERVFSSGRFPGSYANNAFVQGPAPDIGGSVTLRVIPGPWRRTEQLQSSTTMTHRATSLAQNTRRSMRTEIPLIRVVGTVTGIWSAATGGAPEVEAAGGGAGGGGSSAVSGTNERQEED